MLFIGRGWNGGTVEIGNIVKWSWYLGTGWEQTHLQGLIVNSRLVKIDWDKTIVFDVLLTDGSITQVPENEDGLELVA